MVPDADDDAGGSLRRPGPPLSWRDRLQNVADATGTTPVRLLAGGAGLAVAAWVALWLTRAPADPVETSLPFASTSVVPTSSSTTAPSSIVVHVAGSVSAPGVYELAADARVVDAVTAAGGVSASADSARLNLAAPLTDGSRVYVPAVGEAEPTVVSGSSGPADGPPGSGLVNLNQADEVALEALPGVGPATAAAIVEHRERIGGFTSVEQLLDVRGIGEAKLEAMRDHVTV